MESNINHQVINSYSKSFAVIHIKNYFKKKSSITGKEILGFCEIKQVNFFILKILFEKWNQEMDSIKSPYFDYNNAAVKKSVQSMMNVLSKNILIDKDDLQPILEEAVYKTLLLIFSPYEYYLQEINRPASKQISIPDLQGLKKYIKINGHLLNAYIDRLNKDGIQAIFNEDAVQIFDEVCETIKDTPEDFDIYQTEFSKILELDLNEVYSQKEDEQNEQTSETNKQESDNINEKFKDEKQTLLDTLDVEQAEGIADIHGKKPIEGIKKSITINQRFMFESDLFNGDKDEFEMVVNFLDNCSSNQQAMDFINENYLKKKNWDLEKEEVLEFFEVINRRFPQ